MGTRAILRRALLPHGTHRRDDRPLRVLELGAGDGTLMLGLARLIHAAWPPVELTLLDRLDLISPATRDGYRQLGWRIATAVVDVLAWAENVSESFDLVVANLFLHHFSTAQLRKLLQSIAACSGGFFACEPRRSRVSLIGSYMIGAIGANAVTRADSVASVRAGFVGDEIRDLWCPSVGRWTVEEYSAGFFSHCFHARRDNI
jgi:SAM-dependent methyltransferase